MTLRTKLDPSSSTLPSTQQIEEGVASAALSVCQDAIRGNVETNPARPLVNVTNLPSEPATEQAFEHPLNKDKETFIYPNGDMYVGEALDKLPHGFGTLTCKTGIVYEGQFQKGEFSGIGTKKFPTREWYKGEFKKGLFHGFGTLRYGNGDVYAGDFVYGIREGYGTLKYALGGSYDGEYKNNLRHGYGTLTAAEGDVYKGYFQNGLLHGAGKVKFADGRPSLKGQFAFDQFLRHDL